MSSRLVRVADDPKYGLETFGTRTGTGLLLTARWGEPVERSGPGLPVYEPVFTATDDGWLEAQKAEALSAYKAELREKVEGLEQPERYSVDGYGTMWVTDMEHGWESAVAAVLALLDSPDQETA